MSGQVVGPCVVVAGRLYQMTDAIDAKDEDASMALTMTFWPNPVYRNHAGEMRWYFHVSVRQEGGQSIHLWGYRGEWYDVAGHLQDSKEDQLDMHIGAEQHLSYPDLWVTSAIHPFRYRLTLYGREEDGGEVQAEAILLCQ